MCGRSPKPDYAVGAAAQQNAEIARQQFELSKEQLAFEKEQQAKYDPYYTQMLEESIKDAQSNRDRSNEAWNFYKDNYLPIEQKYTQEVMNYDSPEEIAKRTGEAAGTVQRQIDLAREQATRESARMGVSADKSASQVTDDANTMGLAKAGAVNQERMNTKLTGMAMREGAVGLGRGQASLGLSAGAAALQAQQAGISAISTQTQNRIAGNAGANSAATTAISANNSVANIYNQIYQGRVAAANGQSQMMGAGIGAVAVIAAAVI